MPMRDRCWNFKCRQQRVVLVCTLGREVQKQVPMGAPGVVFRQNVVQKRESESQSKVSI